MKKTFYKNCKSCGEKISVSKEQFESNKFIFCSDDCAKIPDYIQTPFEAINPQEILGETPTCNYCGKERNKRAKNWFIASFPIEENEKEASFELISCSEKCLTAMRNDKAFNKKISVYLKEFSNFVKTDMK